VLHSNFGCCIGTIKESGTSELSGAVERRAVPIGELAENKQRQLKEKTGSAARLTIPPTQKLPFALAAVKGQAR